MTENSFAYMRKVMKKLITLNTHSLVEKDYEKKLKLFIDMIEKERPDVIAMQEVSQRIASACTVVEDPYYVPAEENTQFHIDNHALRAAKMLQERGIPYYWSWASIKVSYDIYDEGVAIFSKEKIEDIQSVWISHNKVFEDWAARKALGIQVKGAWYYSVHAGWWEDEREPFRDHWDCLQAAAKKTCGEDGLCFILGDFNSPADVRNQGYDYVASSGWYDTYSLAEQKDAGITALRKIDGWAERLMEGMEREDGLRIDYIWCNRPILVKESVVVADGKNYPVMSDHFGIKVRYKE